ncbi:unnamed protein product [Closterium sp. NIES-65]|nr:unnamed protein product [Closterium sp. NIES-65]
MRGFSGKLGRYRRCMLLVGGVTLVNGILSVILLELIINGARSCPGGNCHLHVTEADAQLKNYDIHSTRQLSSRKAQFLSDDADVDNDLDIEADVDDGSVVDIELPSLSLSSSSSSSSQTRGRGGQTGRGGKQGSEGKQGRLRKGGNVGKGRRGGAEGREGGEGGRMGYAKAREGVRGARGAAGETRHALKGKSSSSSRSGSSFSRSSSSSDETPDETPEVSSSVSSDSRFSFFAHLDAAAAHLSTGRKAISGRVSSPRSRGSPIPSSVSSHSRVTPSPFHSNRAVTTPRPVVTKAVLPSPAVTTRTVATPKQTAAQEKQARLQQQQREAAARQKEAAAREAAAQQQKAAAQQRQAAAREADAQQQKAAVQQRQAAAREAAAQQQKAAAQQRQAAAQQKEAAAQEAAAQQRQAAAQQKEAATKQKEVAAQKEKTAAQEQQTVAAQQQQTGPKTRTPKPFYERMSAKWHVTPLPRVHGAYLLQQKHDYSCVLLVQDLCYLFMAGKGAYHNAYTGVWFVREAMSENSSELVGPYSPDWKKPRGATKGSSRRRLLSSGGGSELVGPYSPEEQEEQERQTSEVLAGHREGRPVCFDQVAFVLNARHLNSSTQGFKEDAWGLAEVAAKVFQRREENGVTGDGNRDFEVEEEMEMGEEEQEKQRRRDEAGSASKNKESQEEGEKRFREEAIQRERTHALARVVIRQGDEVLNAALRGHDFDRKLEVTVVEREEQRTVSNMGEVAWHVKDLFPRHVTNQYHLADSPLLEQMALFQHTALFISMHGASLSNLIFLPPGSTVLQLFPLKFHFDAYKNLGLRNRINYFIMHGASLSNLIFLPPGSTVLELFPFKFHSDAYKNLALRNGINYFMWENTHPEASSYTDDCLAKGGWENLEEKECRNVRGCFLCARDHSVTAVNMEELDKVLLKVQRAVRRFLHEESLKKLHGVTAAAVTA